MKNLHVAALATLFGISAASGIALTQAQHPAQSAGIFAATASIAAADPKDHGRGNRNENGNWQNGQYNQNGCNSNGTRRGDGDNDRDDQGNNQGNNSRGRGHKNGWQNPNNPHYGCANGANYCNGQYNNGQYNGQCNPNGGGANGNSVVRGTITSVNGSNVTLMAGFGQFITINDQPALNNQQTGRVVVGRYVTAYGYYQNGIFYATSLQ